MNAFTFSKLISSLCVRACFSDTTYYYKNQLTSYKMSLVLLLLITNPRQKDIYSKYYLTAHVKKGC